MWQGQQSRGGSSAHSVGGGGCPAQGAWCIRVCVHMCVCVCVCVCENVRDCTCVYVYVRMCVSAVRTIGMAWAVRGLRLLYDHLHG